MTCYVIHYDDYNGTYYEIADVNLVTSLDLFLIGPLSIIIFHTALLDPK